MDAKQLGESVASDTSGWPAMSDSPSLVLPLWLSTLAVAIIRYHVELSISASFIARAGKLRILSFTKLLPNCVTVGSFDRLRV